MGKTYFDANDNKRVVKSFDELEILTRLDLSNPSPRFRKKEKPMIQSNKQVQTVTPRPVSMQKDPATLESFTAKPTISSVIYVTEEPITAVIALQEQTAFPTPEVQTPVVSQSIHIIQPQVKKETPAMNIPTPTPAAPQAATKPEVIVTQADVDTYIAAHDIPVGFEITKDMVMAYKLQLAQQQPKLSASDIEFANFVENNPTYKAAKAAEKAAATTMSPEAAWPFPIGKTLEEAATVQSNVGSVASVSSDGFFSGIANTFDDMSTVGKVVTVVAVTAVVAGGAYYVYNRYNSNSATQSAGGVNLS